MNLPDLSNLLLRTVRGRDVLDRTPTHLRGQWRLALVPVMVIVISLFTMQLAHASGTTTNDNPITDLKVVKTTNPDNNPPDCGTGWKRIDTDLQAGGLAVGGGFWTEPAFYLCYKTGDPSNAITHLYPATENELTKAAACDSGDSFVELDGSKANLQAEGWKVQKDYLCYGSGGDYPLLGIKIETYLGFIANYEYQAPPHGHTLNFGGTLLYLYTRDASTTDNDTTYDCGGEGEDACTIFTGFWWTNGNFGCDRGLKESSGTCVNKNRYSSTADGFIDGTYNNGDWVLWALDNQRTNLAIDEPLNWVMHLGAHNAFNNANNGYTVDPNQQFSATDLLRLGARNLAIDLHFYNSAIRLCHGKSDGTGCVLTDRLYFNILKEIELWLDNNPGEFFVISVEEYLDSNDEYGVNEPIRKYLGDKVYRHEDYASVLTECLSGAKTCTSTIGHRWPTMRELRAAGKQVLITGSGDFYDDYFTLGIHNPFDNKYGSDWNKANDFFGSTSGSGTGTVYPNAADQANSVDCLATPIWANNSSEAALSVANGDNLSVHSVTEDRTYAGTLVADADWPGLLNPDRVASLAKCNIWINMDFYASQSTSDINDYSFGGPCTKAEKDGLPDACPITNDRLAAAVWSWRTDDTGQNGSYAMLANSDKRWVSDNGDNEYHFACAKKREEENPLNLSDREGADWKVTAAVGKWENGNATCQAEFGTSYVFNVPVNGWQNEKLKDALATAKTNVDTGSGCATTPCYDTTSDNVWLNYRKESSTWIPGRSPRISLTYSGAASGAPYEGDATTFENIAPNDGSTLTYAWSVEDKSGTVLATGSNETFTHTFADDGKHTVYLTITDDAGLTATAVLSLTVQNADPTATFSSDGDVNEGSDGKVNFRGAADPGTDDVTAGFIYSYDFDSDGTFEIVDDPLDRVDVPASYLDDGPGSHSVTGRIKDKDGGYTDYQVSIGIANVAPTAAFGNQAGPIFEGTAASLFANPSDPSSTDVTRGLRYLYWGTPYGEEFTNNPDPGLTGSFLLKCEGLLGGVPPNWPPLLPFFVRYGDGAEAGQRSCIFIDGPSNELASAWIIDKDQGQTYYEKQVDVLNVAPLVQAPLMSIADAKEGETVFATADFTDPGILDRPFTCTVNYGDGTGDKTGTVVINDDLFQIEGTCTGPDHVYADDGLYNVVVTVIDKDQDPGSKGIEFMVANAIPTIEAGGDQTVNEGATLSLDPATFNDKGTLDTHTTTVDWGEGAGLQSATVTETPSGPPGSTAGADGTVDASYVYADNGSYTVTVCVKDDENAEACDTLTVKVNNVAPTTDAGLDQTADEGDLVSLAPASFNDKGTLDTHMATVNWGDSTGTQSATVTETPSGPPGSTAGLDGTVDASHVYADNGSYTVTVCVKDDDLDQTCDTMTMTIMNVAPTVNAGLDVVINEAGTFTLAPASFNDKGTLDTHTATINWDDAATRQASTEEPGSVSESPFGPPGSTSGADGTVAGSFVYGDNSTYDVQVCVTDDDGGKTCDVVSVQVDNVKPTLTFDTSGAISFVSGPAFLGRRGDAQTFDSSAGDIGSDDLIFDWTFPPSSLGSQIPYFNNDSSADLAHSPHGVFPFSASDTNRTTFSAPGVYEATIDVSDDDGESVSDSLPLLMTDSRECTAVHATWGHQFGVGGRQTIDDLRLQGYLDVIRFASAYFNDGNLADLNDAEAIFAARGGDELLPQLALAAWLNFTSGGVLWEHEIAHVERPFNEVIAEIDAILLDPSASQAELVDAQQKAIWINTISPGQSSCNDAGAP